MAHYLIGDIHGCHRQMVALLGKIGLQADDCVIGLGDYIGKGPEPWAVLQEWFQLHNRVTIWGNHDLFHIARARQLPDSYTDQARDLLAQLLAEGQLVWQSEDGYSLAVHAGIWPKWGWQQAVHYAQQASQVVRKLPEQCATEQGWDQSLAAEQQWWAVVDMLTNMRVIDQDGCVDGSFVGPLAELPTGHKPWYEQIQWPSPSHQVIFGHWSHLAGCSGHRQAINLDGGCVYGGRLLAYRLEDGEQFFVDNSF